MSPRSPSTFVQQDVTRALAAAEPEYVALYAIEHQIACLVLGKGKEVATPTISAGLDDDLGELQ
jgi:hypothetical protein